MSDLISRQAAIDRLAEDMPSAYTPDGSHPADDGIFMAQEIYADCIQTLKELPPIQPEIIKCKDCKHWVPGYITDNDDFIPPKCGKWQQMVGHSSDDYCSLAESREETT